MDILGFIIAASIIVYSGSKLSKYADLMAESYGWGRMFIGIILLASVTSIPELMTGFSSVVLVDSPDLAVGDIMGSCAFNILIISMMDLFYNPRKSLTAAVSHGHIITASLGMILLALVGVAVLFPNLFGHIGWVGGYSFVFIIVYFIAIKIVYQYEKHKKTTTEEVLTDHKLNRKSIVTLFLVHAIIVTITAMFLPYFGEKIAHTYSLDEGVFGTLFLAASTSLPEIVVSIAAIKMGITDMAIGNIFGSNLFNIAILAIDDIMYTKGPLLSFTGPKHIIPIIGTLIITCIGIIGIVFKSNVKWKLAIDTALIVLVYIVMVTLLTLF